MIRLAEGVTAGLAANALAKKSMSDEGKPWPETLANAVAKVMDGANNGMRRDDRAHAVLLCLLTSPKWGKGSVTHGADIVDNLAVVGPDERTDAERKAPAEALAKACYAIVDAMDHASKGCAQ